MDQAIQLFGCLLALSAFTAAQRGWLSQTSLTYLTLNLVGAAILAAIAAIERQAGFLLLETVWALVSAWGLRGALLARRRAPTTRPSAAPEGLT